MILGRLLAQGDLVSIERGRLVIRPKSGLPVPSEWLSKHEETLICEILAACGRSGFRFVRRGSVGKFDGGKYPGAVLVFVSLASGEEMDTFFNVSLAYQRGAKKGQLLPGGRFTVGRRSALRKLWDSTGIALRRHSELCERLGALYGVVIEGCCNGARLEAKTLRALNVTAADIAACIGKISASIRQGAGKCSATVVGKGIQQSPYLDGSVAGSGRVSLDPRKEHKLTSKELYLVHNCLTNQSGNKSKRPQDQTCDEWLADYAKADVGSAY